MARRGRGGRRGRGRGPPAPPPSPPPPPPPPPPPAGHRPELPAFAAVETLHYEVPANLLDQSESINAKNQELCETYEIIAALRRECYNYKRDLLVVDMNGFDKQMEAMYDEPIEFFRKSGATLRQAIRDAGGFEFEEPDAFMIKV